MLTEIIPIFYPYVDPPALESGSALLYLLKGFWSCANMQRHESIFGDCVGIGAVDQQQLGALRLAVLARLVQGCDAPGGQFHVGPPLQQEPQALSETSSSRDVKRRGQLLLVTQ